MLGIRSFVVVLALLAALLPSSEGFQASLAKPLLARPSLLTLAKSSHARYSSQSNLYREKVGALHAAPTSTAGETLTAEPVPPSAVPASKTVKKLLPLGLMLFFILFNYTILRDTKDVLVVTAPNSGAEIIPFLKTYVNLPSAIAFTLTYSSLSNKMSADKVFYVIMGAFISFFTAFATVICKWVASISHHPPSPFLHYRSSLAIACLFLQVASGLVQ